MSTTVTKSNYIEMTGHAVADKENDSRKLLVYPDRLLPFQQGKLDGKDVSYQLQTKDSKGNLIQANAKASNYIVCYYRDSQSGLNSVPNVRKGESVTIYNYGDTDQWYWKSQAWNDGARRTDSIRFGVSGTLENNTNLNDDNSYFMELDTRNAKHFHISTSKMNGESFRYHFLIDAAKSRVVITDDAQPSNQFFIDSANTVVGMKNKDNSMIVLDKKTISLVCDEDIIMKSNNTNIRLQAEKNIETNSNQSTQMTATKDITISAKSNAVLNGDSSTIVSSKGPINIQAGGGLSMSFVGSGKCDSPGGTMTMTLKHFDINESNGD
jgi:hypothetical protein